MTFTVKNANKLKVIQKTVDQARLVSITIRHSTRNDKIKRKADFLTATLPQIAKSKKTLVEHIARQHESR